MRLLLIKKVCNKLNSYSSPLYIVNMLSFILTNWISMKEKAFVILTNKFKDKLFRVSKRLLISVEEAEDATQEVLLKLWKNKSKIGEYKNVEAFAMTMTKNYCFDKLKAKENGNLKIEHNNYKDENSSLQRDLEAKDSLGWVEKIMNTLPEQQRMVVQLRDIEEYNNAEIAAIMELNEVAVRVALSRGRKKIREELVKKHNYGVV